MSLKTQMQTDIDAVFFNTSDFAYLVDYTVAATAVKTTGLKAIPDFELKQTPNEYGAADLVDWLVPWTDAEEPAMYDVITHDSIDYRVEQARQGDINGTWRISCSVDRRQKPGNVRS